MRSKDYLGKVEILHIKIKITDKHTDKQNSN